MSCFDAPPYGGAIFRYPRAPPWADNNAYINYISPFEYWYSECGERPSLFAQGATQLLLLIPIVLALRPGGATSPQPRATPWV